MSKQVERVTSSLQIEEDIDLHIKGWIAQRIGWLLMLAFLMCAVLGLFGDGILSDSALTANGTTVKFEKYLRRESESQLEIITQDENGKVEVALPPDFYDTYEVDKILPEPSNQKIDNGATVLQFDAAGDARILLFLTTRKHATGSIGNKLKVNNTDFTLNHYIYP